VLCGLLVDLLSFCLPILLTIVANKIILASSTPRGLHNMVVEGDDCTKQRERSTSKPSLAAMAVFLTPLIGALADGGRGDAFMLMQ
jgi:hypothetical protein